MNKEKLNYFNFLRALSILSVFLYHLEIIEGGFLGVDFFFVISGFLIFKVYDEKYKYQKKGIKNFLTSRFKRILPALYVCVFTSTIFFATILSENELRDFGQSIITSSLFLSNVLFWLEAGYYQPIAELKPLLHTWSLSVEMQFYLSICFLYFFFKKKFFLKKNILYIFIFIFILSVIGSEIKDISLFQIYNGLENSSFFDFYLITSRIWQFALGIMVYILIVFNKDRKYLYINFYFYTSLVIVVFSIFYFNKNLNHPGFLSLIPVTFFAFMMYFLYYKNNYYLIENKFLNFTGKISYSLYLYHFIFIVFVKHYFGNLFTGSLLLLLVIFIYFISYISYQFVEKKFYFNKKKTSGFFVFIIIIFLINSFFFLFFQFSEKLNIKFFQSYKIIQIKENNKEFYQSLKKEDIFYNLKINKKNSTFSKKNKILIVGDSHSHDLFLALKSAESQFDNSEFYHQSVHCFKKFKQCYFPSLLDIEKLDVLENINTVIYSAMYDFHNTTEFSINILRDFFVNKHKKKLILANMSPVFYVGNSDPVTTFFLKREYNDFDNLKIEMMEKFAFNILKPDVFTKNNNLKNLTEKFDISLLDRFSSFCNIVLKKCKVISKNKKAFFIDHSHLAKNGYFFLGQDLIKYKKLFN